MKNTVGTILLCVLLVFSVEAQKVSETDAIKAVIENETKAFFATDYDTWMASWLHTPYASWSFADSTGISQFEGWNAIEIGFTDYFLTSKPSNVKIDRKWLEVRIYGNGAFARFKQRVITDGIPGKEQTEIRILEKDKNAWKIVLVGVLQKNRTENEIVAVK